MIPLQVIPLDCSSCGKCCETQSYPPFLEYERPYVPAALLEEIDRGIAADIAAGYIGETPCIWLDLLTRKCKHYEDRPDVCRGFVVGSDDCLTWRDELVQPCGRDSFADV